MDIAEVTIGAKYEKNINLCSKIISKNKIIIDESMGDIFYAPSPLRKKF